jgi:hypothetical protein
MKIACLFATISLSLSVSAAATLQNDNVGNIRRAQAQGNGNKGSSVILLDKCRSRSKLPFFQKGASSSTSSANKAAATGVDPQSSLCWFFFVPGIIIYSICSSYRLQGTRNWIQEQRSRYVYNFS